MPRNPVAPLMSACVILAVSLVAAINLAIPKLAASSLDPTRTQLVWIVDAYVIVFACLLIPAGSLGDRLGRKGVLLAGLGVFAAGGVLAALAPAAGVLIAARAVMGAGAALVMPATLSLMLQSAPAERRGHAIGVWTAATGVAGAVGNFAGGAVLQYLPWQGLFWTAAPAALVLLALTARYAPRGERHPAAADLPGTALLVLGFVALLYGIIEGPERGWSAGPVLAAFAAAAVILGGFVARSLRAAQPLVDPRLFVVARLRAGALGVTVLFLGLFALFYVNAQYLQYAKGYSPLVAGLAIGPLAVGMLAFSKRAIPLSGRVGARPVAAAGFALLAGGLGLLSLTGADTPYPLYGLVLLALAAGMGLAMPVLSAQIIAALPAHRAGLGSGLNSAVREVGSALGVAVMATVLAGHFGGAAPRGAAAVAAFTDGMAAGYRTVAVAVAAFAVLIVVWLREPAA
ncbi:MFS transporter [Streptomyces coryli]|nr:MFS transporter [Streptomyces coryli]